jgi:hypothetical protein
VTGNLNLDNASTLLGRGDGSLGEPINHGESTYGISTLVIGDLNGDGKMDLGIGDQENRGPVPRFALMLGNGDGSFGPIVDDDSMSSTGACQVAMGDLDGDGRLDLVGLTYFDIRTLFGQPAGLPVPGPELKLDEEVCALAAGQLNDDGKLDLILGTPNGDNRVRILLGVGDGSFF